VSSNREARKAQIAAYVKAATLEGKTVTVREIVKALGLKKSPYIDGLLGELVDWGIVYYEMGLTDNGLPIRFYSATHHEYFEFLGDLIEQYREGYW